VGAELVGCSEQWETCMEGAGHGMEVQKEELGRQK